MAKIIYTDVDIYGVTKFKNNIKTSPIDIDKSSFNISSTGTITGTDSFLSDSVIVTLGTEGNKSLQIATETDIVDTNSPVTIRTRVTNDNKETKWVTIFDSSASNTNTLPDTNAYTIDSTGGAFNINLTTPKSTISILKPEGSNDVIEISLLIKQGTGANLVTWSPNVKWSFDRPVVLSYTKDSTDIISLISYDAGVTWYGALVRAGV